MIKKVSTLFMLLFFTSFFSFSQEITVSGTVIDETGVIPGVNVIIKGTQKGTASDFEGKYTINATQGSVLIFSSVGYKTQEIIVNRSIINVTLVQNTDVLEEVVVTAYNIKRSEKELTYAVSQVKAEELNLTGQVNAMTALQGTVAGLQVSQPSGTAGGGVDILIRGMSSMNPNQNNQPLIVVDGVAFNNDNFSGNMLPAEGSNASNSKEQFSFSSRIGDINPKDIESYSVLKGAAATALYGVRGANGVIMITTKRGKLGKAKFNVGFSTTISKVTKTPELQKVFRQGIYGETNNLYNPNSATGYEYIGGTSSSGPYNWGVSYLEDSVVQDGVLLDLSNDRFYNPYDLFRNAISKDLDFNVSGATEKMDYYFSINNNSSDGVIPYTNFGRTSFRLKAGYKVSDSFKINTSVQYTTSDSRKPTGGDKSIISALGYWSPTFPVNDFLNPDGTPRNGYPGWIDNPKYNAYISGLTENTNRWVGNINLNWTPKDWVSVNYAAQVDNYNTKLNRFSPAELDVGSTVNGFIIDQTYEYYGLESNLLVTFNTQLADKFKTTLTLGNAINDNKRTSYRMYGQNLNLPHYNHISNAQENFIINNNVTQIRNFGFFGELKLDYDNKLFFNITGRQDWDSTLPANNNTYFYPSASLAYDVSSLINNTDILSFGKLRVNYAEVGNGTTFGQVGSYFIPAADFPWGGTGGYSSDRNISDANLKPERTKGWEFGTDLRFMNNRLRIDYAYYKNKIVDAIFPTNTAPSTSVVSIQRNSGVYETFGHELLVSASIVKSNDFDVDLTYNFDKTNGKVVALPDEVPYINFSGDLTGARLYLRPREGDKIGAIYGYKFARSDAGDIIIDASNGLPTTSFTDDDLQIVGNATPDFTMSLGSNLRYKNFRFNFLVEWKKGGDKYSWQRYILNRMGQSEFTMQFRKGDGQYLFDGVIEDPANPGTYIPNTVTADFSPTSTTGYKLFNWTSYGRRNAEYLLQDASWVKLRSIGFSYNLNNDFLNRIAINEVTLSANVNNILIWTPFDGFDPEGSDYSAGSNRYGFTGRGIPLTENYSFGVTIGF